MKKIDFNGSEYKCCTDIQEVKATPQGEAFKEFNSIGDLLSAWLGKATVVDEDGSKHIERLPRHFDFEDLGKPAAMFHTEDRYNCLSITLFKLEDLDPEIFEREYTFEFDDSFGFDPDHFFMEDESGQIWFARVDFD